MRTNAQEADVVLDRVVWGLGGTVIIACAAVAQFVDGHLSGVVAWIAATALLGLVLSRCGVFTRMRFATDAVQFTGALAFFAAVIMPLTSIAGANIAALMMCLTGFVALCLALR